MEVNFEALSEEGQIYLKLQQELERSPNPDAGEPAFLVSYDWIHKYEKFIQYDRIKINMKPQWTEDHFKKNDFPGIIKNYDILEHDKNRFLEGTGALKGFESSVFDRQLKENLRE